jgi:hypothetical protein
VKTDDADPDTERFRSRNRRLIALRAGDPDGSVDACERIEADFPGVRVNWLPENTRKGFEGAAGYYGSTLESSRQGWRARAAYGASEGDLAAELRSLGSSHALFAREDPYSAQFSKRADPPWGAADG